MSKMKCLWILAAAMAFLGMSLPGAVLDADIGFADSQLVVSVPAGQAAGKRLCLVWGAEDQGEKLTKWTNSRLLSESVPDEGLNCAIDLDELTLENGQKLRVLALDTVELLDRVQMNSFNAGITTAYKDTDCYRVEFGFYQTGGSSSWSYLLGTNGENGFNLSMNNTSTGSWVVFYRGAKQGNRPAVYTDRMNAVEFNGNYTLNGQVKISGFAKPVGTTGNTMKIGSYNSGRYMLGWWYYIRFLGASDNPLIDYLPAQLGTRAGFYDGVTEKMVYSNCGTDFVAGTSTNGVKYVAAASTEVFNVDDTQPVAANWIGGGDVTDLSDSANWACVNLFGDALVDAIPLAGVTKVTIAGDVGFNVATAADAIWKKAVVGSCSLQGDCDWKGMGELAGYLAPGATIDLNGHTLAVSQRGGAAVPDWSFTDTSAGEGGTLIFNVPSGIVDQGVMSIGGNLKLVKDGAGILMMASEDFTGGAEVVAGVLGFSGNARVVKSTYEWSESDGNVTVNLPFTSGGKRVFLLWNDKDAGDAMWDEAQRLMLTEALPGNGAVFIFNPVSMGIPADAFMQVCTVADSYRPLDRLQMTTTGCYIQTAFTDIQCYRVALGFYFTGSAKNLFDPFIGTVGEDGFSVGMNSNAMNSWCWWYKGTKHGDRPTVSVTEMNAVDFKNGEFWLNGSRYANNLGTPVGTSGNRMYIGGSNYQGRYGYGWWYYVRFYGDDGKALLDYIPVQRVSDDKVGFYDYVTRSFVTSSGNGNFTAGSVTNGVIYAGYSGYPVFTLDRSRVATALWVGAEATADKSDAANWNCTNYFGECVAQGLPTNICTRVTVPDLNRFQVEAGEQEPWYSLSIDSCTLTGDCDLTGAKKLASTGTIDLNGNQLRLGFFGFAGTVTDTSTGTAGELHAVIADNQVNSTVTLTGGLKLVKEGTGTLTAAKTGQTYIGGTLIAAGKIKLNCTGSMAGAGCKPLGENTASIRNTITVDSGAVLDIGVGAMGWGYHNLVLNGGTLNGCTTQPNFNLSLTADSTIDVIAAKSDFGSSSYGGIGGSLNGHTLHIKMDTGRSFFVSGSLRGPGTLHSTTYGGWTVFAGANTPADHTTCIDYNHQMATKVNAATDVWNYYANSNSTYMDGTALMRVFGTFTPAGTSFYGCEMQNGSTVDLSAKSAVWSTTRTTTGANMKGNGTVTFADNAKVTVKLGAWVTADSTSKKVVAWTDQPHASVKFYPESALKAYWRLASRADGLYFERHPNLVIYVR